MSTGAVADVVHGMATGDAETVGESKTATALSHLARNADSFPFLMSISAALESLEGNQDIGSRLTSFVDREMGGLIPAAVANIAEATDRTIRHPQGLAQTLESRVPGMTQRVPPALDVTGKPVQRPASELGGANPFPVTTPVSDPLVTELARLGMATMPAPKSVKLRGKLQTLTQDESAAIASQEGREFASRAANLIAQPAYARRSDAQKRAALTGLRKAIEGQRARRLSKMRQERLNSMDALGARSL